MKNTAVTDRINLYQMYDQTVEDFMVCEGDIEIIENGEKNIHFYNVFVLPKIEGLGEKGNEIMFKDNDNQIEGHIDLKAIKYSDISNMRYYPDTHTLTITL